MNIKNTRLNSSDPFKGKVFFLAVTKDGKSNNQEKLKPILL